MWRKGWRKVPSSSPTQRGRRSADGDPELVGTSAWRQQWSVEKKRGLMTLVTRSLVRRGEQGVRQLPVPG